MATCSIFDEIIINEKGFQKFASDFEYFLDHPEEYAVPKVNYRMIFDAKDIDQIVENLVF